MLKPMLASLEEAPLADPQLVYEPKYDGIRVIAEVSSRAVRLWSRLGNEKTQQFPEVVAALAAWGVRLPDPVVLDGEVVALGANGEPTGFQQLQGRIHLTEAGGTETDAVAFITFDVLRAAGHDLRDRPLYERRDVLERLAQTFGRRTKASRVLRISEQVRGDGRTLYARALASGWEGLIVKHVDSRYRSGKRTPDWRKLKIVHEQEFVIGGWTEPRNARAHFGALLLGVYEDGALVYVGHTGTGFGGKELERVGALLRKRAAAGSPFATRPKTNERPHWVTPDLVAQVKFTEWTSDGKLRHPVYQGLRDDKRATDVRRESTGRLHASVQARLGDDEGNADRDGAFRAPRKRHDTAPRARTARAGRTSRDSRPQKRNGATRQSRTSRRGGSGGGEDAKLQLPTAAECEALVETLQALENAREDATIELGDGRSIAVTNLHKPFWPALKLTKGDLFRYHARVARFLLPAIADRPLVMKRYPNGVAAKPFYQHRASDVPAGVRVEAVPGTTDTGRGNAARPHLIGGDLLTLLYTTQLAAISQDPWFSRIQTPGVADYVALDLDPSDDLPFRQVLDVARAIRDTLASIGAEGMAKTSGASGLHIYIPLPPDTPYDAGLLFCQMVATVVTQRHPKIATIERSVRARGKRVYVDYLQNSMGKTLASAYSARASDYAGVSTPLTWDEIEAGVEREDFTIMTIPDRLTRVGDLWKALRRSKGVDLESAAAFGL